MIFFVKLMKIEAKIAKNSIFKKKFVKLTFG